MRFANKTALITGSSRGIGKAIALKLASEGANIIIAAKSVESHPKLEGTIYTAAAEVDAAGPGQVLACAVDIRNEEQVQALFQQTAEKFGKIDVLVNNASAIDLSTTESISLKKFDLMHQINVRGTLLISQTFLPLLKKGSDAHVLNLSPPLNLSPKWFGKHLPYTMNKYGMSMIVLGLSQELRKYNIAVNALWPKTTIATAAVQNLLGGEKIVKKSRNAMIVADAAAVILSKPSPDVTGNFFIDEDVLRAEGVEDFSRYAIDPDAELFPDLFL